MWVRATRRINYCGCVYYPADWINISSDATAERLLRIGAVMMPDKQPELLTKEKIDRARDFDTCQYCGEKLANAVRCVSCGAPNPLYKKCVWCGQTNESKAAKCTGCQAENWKEKALPLQVTITANATNFNTRLKFAMDSMAVL